MSETTPKAITTLAVQLDLLDCRLRELGDFLEINQEPSSEKKAAGTVIDGLMASADVSIQRVDTIYREVKKLVSTS